MFTGLVEELGAVRRAEPGQMVVACRTALDGLAVADSIAVNGVCLTVVARDQESFAVDVVPETLRRTNLGDLTPGDPVNLERSLRADGRLGGHIVQGHVDATGELVSLQPDGSSTVARIRAPDAVMRYVVEKGFIALDGASLTVVDVLADGFTVALIPYTRDHVATVRRGVGTRVNLEVDILAKYVERLMADRAVSR